MLLILLFCLIFSVSSFHTDDDDYFPCKKEFKSCDNQITNWLEIFEKYESDYDEQEIERIMKDVQVVTRDMKLYLQEHQTSIMDCFERYFLFFVESELRFGERRSLDRNSNLSGVFHSLLSMMMEKKQ